MDLKSRIEDVSEKVKMACERSGRSPDEITLVAVSKNFGIDKIEEAYDLGLRDFGENYAQEFRDKYDEIKRECCLDIKWHFIGTLQTNKVKYVVGKTHLIHTVDSERTASELDKKAERLGVKVNSLIEVNISGENSKNGIKPNELKNMLNSLNQLKNVNILGLMGMTPYFINREKTRPYFKKLRRLRDEIQAETENFKELSMGMSGDFEVAIEEGATIIRLGSSIFGDRPS